MRLTLRTLLMYLDDTLEPAEIKAIGQKVAESTAAQELIDRIRQVTRRRRLTTPPATGPAAKFDANTIAEYLDNELSAEQVADLERVCLESDVHLAEIAACHQILTLVQEGEPALVPPSAKERMYRLVQGREAIPFRKATSPSAQPAAGPADGDGEEAGLLGMRSGRRGAWPPWALPVAAVLALAGVGVALWLALLGMTGRPPGHAEQDKKAIEVVAFATTPATPTDTSVPKPSPSTGPAAPPTSKPPPPPPPTTAPKPPPPTTSKGSPAPPNQEKARAGKYFHDPMNTLPSILLRKEPEAGAWQRLGRNDEVHTADTLMSLPGYASEVRLDSGVRLVLRGLVPEFSRDPLMAFLLDTAVVLHKNADFDADLTLDRGRLYISNTKDNGPATVRLRFGKDGGEVWDLTLEEPDTEIGIDLPKNYSRDVNLDVVDEPRMELYLQVLHGRAAVRVTKAFVTYPNLVPPPGPGFFEWDNYRGEVKGPQVITNKEVSERIWKKSPPTKMENPAADEMVLAIKELSTRMVTKQPPTLHLKEMLQAETTVPAGRRLAIYCMCGLDDVRGMLEALGDEHDGHGGDRETAIYALRRWLARDAGQSQRLYDAKKQTGLLRADALAKTYTTKEARTIAELLRNFTEEERQSKETYELLATHMRSSKVAIAELAYWHLRRLAHTAKLPLFNAAWTQEQRQGIADKVRSMIEMHELPPPPEGPPGDGGKPVGPSKPGTR